MGEPDVAQLRQRRIAAEDQSTKPTKNISAGAAGVDNTKHSKSCARKLCMTLLWTICSFVALTAIGYGYVKTFHHDEMQMFLMRFFRDLSRAKAHMRLHGNGHAIMTVLTGNEDLLPINEAPDDGFKMSAEELREFNGLDGAPLYLAIMGRIYDVSRGSAFYAPGRSYHHYVGKDATRSFATGCTREECLVPSLAGCTESQKQEARRWLELYEHHDKYRFVGVVRADPVSDLVEQEFLEQEVLSAVQDMEAVFSTDGDGGRTAAAERRSAKARERYQEADRNLDEAILFWKSALVALGEASTDDDLEVVMLRADIVISMAAALQHQSKYGAANEYYQEALDGITATLGMQAETHPLYARAQSDRAAALFMQGDRLEEAVEGFRAASQSYEAAIAKGEQSGGEGTLERTVLEAANTQLNLGLALLEVAIQDEERLGEGTGAELKAEAKQLLQKLITKHQDSDDKRYQKILNVARSVITSL
eukprot:m.1055576 g.1055576  ORF g.1055576 m.1055576 type:complete len:479 (+) comp24193_c0_seq2:95-1531(+)